MKKRILFIVIAILLVVFVFAMMRHSTSTWSSPQRHGFSSVSSASSVSSDSSHLFLVTHVVDGDTIDVLDYQQKKFRIRFIGIDTPETVDERKPVQCYGPESSEHLKELLGGATVQLEKKPDEDKDDYGRLLRYVLSDGKDIGAAMIEEGYARSLCAAFPHPRCASYDALEAAAKAERRGRWGRCR